MNKIGEYQVACSRYATSAGSILKVITTLNLPVWDKLYVNRLRQFQSFMTITCSTTPHLVVDENNKHFHLHARHFEFCVGVNFDAQAGDQSVHLCMVGSPLVLREA